MEQTKIYDTNKFNIESVHKELLDIFNILEEKGYNPIVQITGYLISGDPGYISNYKEARNRITKLERSFIVETLLKDFIK